MVAFPGVIGESAGIVTLRRQLTQLLEHHATMRRLPPLLLLGETGTGKGLLAREIHRAGPRAAGPFVAINCAAIPDTLLEAELFGFEKGAFTDARQAKAGLFQTAHHGTLFLDEISLLADALQGKLLTALEDQAVRRLGSTRVEPVDVWVLAAASDDLQRAVRAKRFREELYHRLAVVILRLPPLRERGSDVLVLAEHFLARACKDYGLPSKQLGDEARGALLAYRWPGNVRELANVMERVALLTATPTVMADDLGLPATPGGTPAARADPGVAASPMDEAERTRLLTTLRETGWNVSRTAVKLGLARNAVRYRIQKYGLHPDPAAGEPHGATPASSVPDEAAPRKAPSSSASGPAGRPPVTSGARSDPGAAHTPAMSAPAGLRWEQRHVALLRVEFAEASLPTPFELDRALEAFVDKVQTFDGRLEELGASGIVAAFGLEPLDDAPGRAAHAAMTILNVVERHRRRYPEQPTIRAALHVASLLVGRVGSAAVQLEQGARREAWARLEALSATAEPGTVIISEEAAPFLERRFMLAALPTRAGSPRGAHRLEGLERTGLGLGGALTQLVGRQEEVQLLERQYREACGNEIRMVSIVGDPGIGKSRLVYECRQRLVAERALILQGHCTAFGRSTPFLPFVEAIRAAFLLEEADGPEEVTRKLRAGLELLGLPAEANLPFLQVLLGLPGDDTLRLDPETVGIRSRDLLHQILRERCRLSPVILILDDLHWGDTASVEFLVRLLESQDDSPLLILATYRPPFQPPWIGRPKVTELRLGPLNEESCLQLVHRRLAGKALPEAVVRLVVDKAEGNPLFVEELTRYLAERGRTTGRTDGLGARAGSDPAPLPASLRQLLLDRIEQLAPGPRLLLQVASVIGRRTSADLIRMVLGTAGDVTSDLRALEAQELLVADRTRTQEEYVFKHVLIQDAVYDAIAQPARANLHQGVADAIERMHRSRLGEWAEVLAHHYSQSPRTDKAVRYLVRAGEKSLRVFSLEEADRYFSQAMDLLDGASAPADGAAFAEALLGRVEVCFYRGDQKGVIALAERYRDRIEALGDPRRLSRLLSWQGVAHCMGAQFGSAKPLLERARALAESVGDQDCLSHAAAGLAWACWLAPSDRPGDAVEELAEQALAIPDRPGHLLVASQCLTQLVLYKISRGQYSEARALSRQLIDLGRRMGAPRPTAMGLRALAWAELYEECYTEALGHADEALRIAPSPVDRLIANMARGAALTFLGRAEEAIELLGSAREEIIRLGTVELLLRVDIPYGLAQARTGATAAGVRMIEDAIARFTAWGNKFAPAFGRMALGELYLAMARGDPASPGGRRSGRLRSFLPFHFLATRRARRQLEEAIRLARESGLMGVLARSLLGLGLLCEAEGRRDDARRHLEQAREMADTLASPVLSQRIQAALEAYRSRWSA
jgi:transcriptional regulator with AAA-type ATPase domain/tetratricopeptide (TPR) repeat protein